MATHKTSHLIYFHDSQEEEFDVDVTFDYTISKGRPAKLNAAPEDCYPEEYPELEIELVTAEINYGSHKVDLKDSRWWDVIEEELNESETLFEELAELETGDHGY